MHAGTTPTFAPPLCRLISGMHSSITAHVANDYLIDEATLTWGPNLEMFKWRLGNPQVKDRWAPCLVCVRWAVHAEQFCPAMCGGVAALRAQLGWLSWQLQEPGLLSNAAKPLSGLHPCCLAPRHQGGEPVLFVPFHATCGHEGGPHPSRRPLRHRQPIRGCAYAGSHAQVGMHSATGRPAGVRRLRSKPFNRRLQADWVEREA
jgi:hypothetical protein